MTNCQHLESLESLAKRNTSWSKKGALFFVGWKPLKPCWRTGWDRRESNITDVSINPVNKWKLNSGQQIERGRHVDIAKMSNTQTLRRVIYNFFVKLNFENTFYSKSLRVTNVEALWSITLHSVMNSEFTPIIHPLTKWFFVKSYMA